MSDVAIVGLVLGTLAIYFGRGLYLEFNGATVRVHEPTPAPHPPQPQARRKRKRRGK